MQFPSPLVEASLIRRYKRFLADVTLAGGEQVTVAVPNTGSMMGLTTPGSRVWLSVSDNPGRKYRHSLEIVEANGVRVGINTALPNRIVEEAIVVGLIPSLSGYATLKREQRYGENSRIDLLLDDPARGRCYVEVKNVHMSRMAGLAEFPDSVTTRGAKHLEELGEMVVQGHRAVMVYLIQRDDCSSFQFCRDLDPNYGEAFDRAAAGGVEAMALACSVTPTAITATHQIPINPTSPGQI
jgi:sugar fermentation stimulation protein A